MDESAPRRLPWGLLLTLGLLTLLLLTLPPLRPPTAAVAPWHVLLALAAFLVLRWQQGYLWGVLAALLLPLHPLYPQWTKELPQALRAEALELTVLAAVTYGWRLTFAPAFAWKSWLAMAAVLIVAGALAWPAWPQSGLVAGLLVLLGLGWAVVLAWRVSRTGGPNGPALSNRLAAVLVSLAAPAAALFLAPAGAALSSAAPLHWPLAGDAVPEDAAQLLAQALPGSGGLELRGFYRQDLEQWAWPTVWLALSLTAWGLWSCVRRGFKEAGRRRPPLAWLLLLFALLELACMTLHAATQFLPLASLAVLLAVFGVGDVARSIGEGLVLEPPGERQSV